MRMTFASPEGMIADVRELWKATAAEQTDIIAFATSPWRDAAGNLYALGSFEVAPEWVSMVQSPLKRPAWDTPNDSGTYSVNLAAAERARNALALWLHHMESATPLPNPANLTAIGGIDSRSALAMLGLTRVGMT